MSDVNQQQLQSLVLSAELNSENENLEQLGPIIKSIYDTGTQEAFLDQLSIFVRKKEGEIERMCNSNYQVRQGTVNLKNKIIHLNDDLHNSGIKVAAKKKELIQTRRIQKNIDEAVETLQLCLHILDLANRVTHLIESKKYYSALRTLEELQNVHLRKVIQYEFAKHMQESIPAMQNNVKDAVTKEMKEWLFKVRQDSRQVGKIAMEQMRLRQERWSNKLAQNPNLRVVPIDFKPLYQCLHIYEELGKRNEFKTNYEEDRKAQANLVLSQSFSLKAGRDNGGFEAFLQDVIGFFIIERTIVYSTQNFRSQTDVDNLWNTVMIKVVKIVSDSLCDCHDPDLFLRIKLALFTFIQTLEDYEYNVLSFTDLVLTVFQRYSDLLKHKFSKDFQQTLLIDDYMPMQITNPEEYAAVVDTCWFKEDHRITYPCCCLDIKSFINQYYEFAEGDARRYSYVDDIAKQTLDILLIEHLNQVLYDKLQSTNMSQIVQIIINLEYLEYACVEIEKLLKSKRSSHRGGKIKLNALEHFRETRKKAEKRIYELVNFKIDDFLEIADYDCSTLYNLPMTIKIFIYLVALSHLSTSLRNLILSPDVKRINSNAIANFDVDVNFLEQFAQSLEDPQIADAFIELRQIVTLLQSENIEEYLNPSTRNKKYSGLKPSDVINLFEK
ncbi:18413_t:CDS:10 [Entrophospora sp. SA101]|nr:18413_t:CDS:10 [Entrophospora sp. SA101]